MLARAIYPIKIGQILILFANMRYVTQMATLIVATNGNHCGNKVIKTKTITHQ